MATKGLQVTTAVQGAGLGTLIGLQAECVLTGANESPVLSDLTLRPDTINLRRKQDTAQSALMLTLAGDSLSLDAVIARSNGELILYLYALQEDGTRWLAASYTFNFDDFDFSEGGNGGTLTLFGSKYLNRVGSGSLRTLRRWHTRNVQFVGLTETVSYKAPIMDVLALLPADWLSDGTNVGQITTLTYALAVRSSTAAITMEIL